MNNTADWANDTIPDKYKYELMKLMKKWQTSVIEARKELKPRKVKMTRLAWFK